VTRPSSTSTPIDLKVSLYLTQQPERFQIRPELGKLLDLKEETQLGVVNAIWSYVKRERLQDVNDKRVIRCDKALSEVGCGFLLPAL
jgi:SWI/SNF-related matrix-associated actin-dependent regulator of chromatin subfamily D